MPATLGSEGAGTVESVGAGVTEFAPGDRVAYAMARGSYAEYAVVPAAQLVKVPAGVDFQTAAAAMLQGMTAHYLTHSTFALKSGDTCLVHAAAGGAGCCWCKWPTASARASSAPSPRKPKRSSPNKPAPTKSSLYATGFRSRGEAPHRRPGR
jgi:NADPH:quinone reductase-like Zn-dependent oxidoreductase